MAFPVIVSDADHDEPAEIRVLPPEVAARIAAGEVIERPASVVKELIENSLDAGASRIDVVVEAGGVERIRVHDDGCGIPSAQLMDAFRRHATSKLESAEDLFTIRSLGFRGEALAALVAAAKVDCTTRVVSDAAATVVRFRGGHSEQYSRAAAAPGTSIEVRDLFAELPARRAFLRSPRAEARAVARVLSDYALAYPAVAFRLKLDKRLALSSPGNGDVRAAWASVYDEEIAAALLEIEHREYARDGHMEIMGWIGPPEKHRGNRSALHVVANGRAIVDRGLTLAVERAYQGLLPVGRYPLGLLRITLPPTQLDVNVHPTKAEVRFRDEGLVVRTLGIAVRDALMEAPAPSLHGDKQWEGSPAPLGVPSSGRVALNSARVTAPDLDYKARKHDGELPLGDQLPALRPLGQFDSTFLVAESPDGLYLIDQHAAHERVLYERVQTEIEKRERATQPLLQAVVASLSMSQAASAVAEMEMLTALGWVLEPTDDTALIVRAVPALLADDAPAIALGDLLDRMEADERLSGPDRVAASLACRASIRAGDRVAMDQQRELLIALEGCSFPQTCPHGRPTLLRISREYLRRSFGRSPKPVS